MHRHILTSLLCIFILSSPLLLAIEGRLMRYPDIHQDKIVFTYEDDLWLVSSKGGTAARITSHPGSEKYAKFSPDGKKIAFTASYDGNEDVYIISSSGGEPERLTYHPEKDEVVEWHPHGKKILFRSQRTLDWKGYLVSITGTYPENFPVDRLCYGSFSQQGTRLAFNRNNSDRMNWKGYKGGAQQDIWITDIKTGTFHKITTYRGYDTFPMLHENNIYFASDREDGRMNIYVYSLTDKKITRKTFHNKWDVEFPSIGGEKIVYSCEGFLWVYDIPSEKTEKIYIEIPTDRWLTRDTYIYPSDYVQEITLSQNGETAVVQARGDIYLLNENQSINLTQTPSSREIYPAMSPDSQWVAFFSDKTGEYELYIKNLKYREQWIQLTNNIKTTPYHVMWSPDSEKLLFGEKDYNLYIIDIDTKKLKKIDSTVFQKDNEIYWEISEYDWSPDSKWIAYSKCEKNMNSSIFLYNIESDKIFRVTDDRYDDTSPSFDKNGRYFYFLSLRNFDPCLDPFMDNNINDNMSVVFLVQLHAGMKQPFEDQEEREIESEIEPGPIEPEGISQRIFPVPVMSGTYKSLKAIKNGFFYLSKEKFGFPSWYEFVYPKMITSYSLHKFDLQEKRTSEVIYGIGYYNLSHDGSKIAYISGTIYGVIEPIGESIPGDGALDWHGLRQKVNTFQEYTNIFTEVWRQFRDFFYDPDMHGKDWSAIRKKYEALIPFAGNRSDLNYIIGQMTGELTASHEYILDYGDRSRTPFDKTVNVGLLGADLKPDPKSGYYRFDHIISGTNWNRYTANPLQAPHIKISKGDYLLSIDNQPITIKENYLKSLVDKAGNKITLTVNNKPDTSDSRTYQIKTMYSEYDLRYHEWKEDNYKKVKNATNEQVGYIHISDMEEIGLGEFEQGFRAERYRDGIIIDVRNNTGGFVSWFLIDKLERKLSFIAQTRDLRSMRYPHSVHSGHLVFLCNEKTGSDGEIFIQHAKELGLGPVIGTNTWGGLIGYTNIIPTVDGGIVTQPNIGFANLKGQWIVENEGARPDINVENLPEDVLAGRDPQLDKAIEVITEMIKNNPPPDLKPPPFPKR